MNWTMPYPWTSRRDSVRRINMSSEPGNESFFCALRPIPRILSLRRRDYASQVQIGEPSRRKTISGCSRAPDGQWLAFAAGNLLKKIAIEGGGIVTLGPSAGPVRGLTWGDDGFIVAGHNSGSGALQRFPAAGEILH